jgi:hypothetical protein
MSLHELPEPEKIMNTRTDDEPITLPRWVVIELQGAAAATFVVLGMFKEAGLKLDGLDEVDFEKFAEALELAEAATGYPEKKDEQKSLA